MLSPISDDALDVLFRDARTFNAWTDDPVTDVTLQALYDLLRWAPTSFNCCPARFRFLTSPGAKERLKPHLSDSNVDKTMAAPVTAIVAYDIAFYSQLPKLAPHIDVAGWEARSDEQRTGTARMNGTLQGGYFILAARALGLDCGPMAGFSNAGVDEEFFAGTTLRSNFLCNLGYGDPAGLRPRAARLDFDEACEII